MQHELKRYTDRLPCPLTPEDVASKADELARTLVRIEDREENKTLVRKELAEEINLLKHGTRVLAREVRERAEQRDVEVIECMTMDGVTVTRTDTGEILNTREPTAQERQLSIIS